MYFQIGQYVNVTDSSHFSFRDRGIVARLNSTGGAWVDMEGNIHSSLKRFPEGDVRAKWVELRPEQCELLEVPAPMLAVHSEPEAVESPWMPNSVPLPENIQTISSITVGISARNESAAKSFVITRNGNGGLQVNVQCESNQEASRMMYRFLKTIMVDPKSREYKIEIQNIKAQQ